MEPTLDDLLRPWHDALGRDRGAYENHVRRILALCESIAAAAAVPVSDDDRHAWLVAGAFHDLGIWSAGTWDYLDPSVALAWAWLTEHEQGELAPLVTRMIREHHGVRPRGPATDPVEIFRRADVIDVWLGLFRYGTGLAHYRALLREFPDVGFHWRLTTLFTRNLLRHPLRPLPMFRW